MTSFPAALRAWVEQLPERLFSHVDDVGIWHDWEQDKAELLARLDVFATAYEAKQQEQQQPDSEDEITRLKKQLAAGDAALKQVKSERDDAYEYLEHVLTETPLPNGNYVHRPVCNGDRTQPPGTRGITCNCLPSKQAGDAARAALRDALDELVLIACSPANAGQWEQAIKRAKQLLASSPPERTT